MPIEVKIPKEIREYRESIFFGLSARQFTCSLLALGAAVGLCFLFDPLVGTEGVGWICILGAAPFAVCGFWTYHGMTAEQTLWAWFKSQVLTPRRLVFRSDCLYYQALQPAIEQGKKPPRKKKKRKAKEPAGEKAPAPKPERLTIKSQPQK